MILLTENRTSPAIYRANTPAGNSRYRRVSSWEQRTDRQLEGVELDEVFEDRASGKDLNRPQWEAAAKFLRRGDVLIVHSMDRLARNLADLLATVEGLNRRGVEVRFVHENLNFEPGASTNPMAKLMLSMLGAVAEFERSLILERQREGIALAKQRGGLRRTKAGFVRRPGRAGSAASAGGRKARAGCSGDGNQSADCLLARIEGRGSPVQWAAPQIVKTRC